MHCWEFYATFSETLFVGAGRKFQTFSYNNIVT